MPYKDPKQQREYQRKWMQDRRAEFFSGKSCATPNCKGKDLQLHHLNPAEKVSHRIWSWTKVRREAELKKCVILCQGCHLRAHGNATGSLHERRQQTFTPNTA